jgi:hypothetical protein
MCFLRVRLHRVRKRIILSAAKAQVRGGEHALAPSNYCRVDVGDVSGLVKVLCDIERAVVDERKRQPASERMAVS